MVACLPCVSSVFLNIGAEQFKGGGSLKVFAYEVLSGTYKRPTPRGDKPPVLERNTLLISIVERVHELYGIRRAAEGPVKTEADNFLVCSSNIAYVDFFCAEVKPHQRELTPEQAARIVRDEGEARRLAREKPYLAYPAVNALAPAMEQRSPADPTIEDLEKELIENGLRVFDTR